MASPKVVRHDTRKIVRGSGHQQAHEELAVEEPLEIRINKEPVGVLMRTPGDDYDLAAGWLFTEGFVSTPKEIAAMRYGGETGKPDERNVLDVQLADGVKLDLARLKRNVYTVSSLGVCGKGAIELVRQQSKPVDGSLKLKLELFYTLGSALRRAQTVFEQTGGLHAAGVFDLKGTLLGLREDIGRHNAIDKLIGSMFVNNHAPLDHHVLMLSGRASFEVMHKALVARIPVVAAVHAPSSLAVEFAQQMGQTLVGFLRADAFNVYAHADRIEV